MDIKFSEMTRAQRFEWIAEKKREINSSNLEHKLKKLERQSKQRRLEIMIMEVTMIANAPLQLLIAEISCADRYAAQTHQKD